MRSDAMEVFICTDSTLLSHVYPLCEEVRDALDGPYFEFLPIDYRRCAPDVFA